MAWWSLGVTKGSSSLPVRTECVFQNRCGTDVGKEDMDDPSRGLQDILPSVCLFLFSSSLRLHYSHHLHLCLLLFPHSLTSLSLLDPLCLLFCAHCLSSYLCSPTLQRVSPLPSFLQQGRPRWLLSHREHNVFALLSPSFLLSLEILWVPRNVNGALLIVRKGRWLRGTHAL